MNNNPNLVGMKRRKFEEEVVEETTTTETTTEESAPDSHQQFITILTEMGLSAEQAEAIHQMAMDLIESAPEGSGEEQKVEASRMRRRSYSSGRADRMGRHGGRRRMGRGASRRGMGSRRSMSRMEPRGGRRMMSADRMERQMRQQRRQIRELRAQLRELGAQPGSTNVRTAPQAQFSNQPAVPVGNSAKERVMSMLKHTF
jgi:hypothetical protein